MSHEPGEERLDPPAAERVQRRALALSAVVCRGYLEQDAGNAEADRFRESIGDWLREHRVWEELESEEQALLGTPLGKASAQSVVDATWRSEGLVVLAWALGRLEMASHATAVDPKVATDAVGFLSEEPLRDATLRSSEEVAAMADRYFAVHWRLREFSLRRRPLDFEKFAKTSWFGPLHIVGVPLVEGDLEVAGKAITDAAPDELDQCTSIARERHQASNWLRGVHAVYSEVDTST